MEFNKPVSNPMMVGSIELLKAEDTTGTQTDVPGGASESKVSGPGSDRSCAPAG